MKLFVCISLLISSTAWAKLLDKTIAIYDDNVITLSMVDRIRSNIPARRNISPMIYNKSKLSREEVVDILIKSKLIRDKLTEMSHIISDDMVESQITETEKKLGVNRDQLIEFLKQNGMSFDEYFELTKQSMEFNLFGSRVIRPLVSITDQEIKSKYFQMNKNKKTVGFKYNIVDFSMPANKFKKGMLKNFKDVLVKFQKNGILPAEYSSVSTSTLGDVTEDSLASNLKKILQNTEEGSFSKPVKLYDDYHVFFVKKKDLVESDDFLKAKRSIRGMLFEQAAIKISDLWFKREENKHYIRKYIR